MIQSYTKVQSCTEVSAEERHDHRCSAPNVSFEMQGTTYQQCITACRMRENCGFLNHNSAKGMCQLGNFCLEMQPALGTETIVFGEFYHNDCVQWLPLNVEGRKKIWWSGASVLVSRLTTDTYAMPGAMNLTELKIPHYDGSGDPFVVTTTRPDEISYLSYPTGCTHRWNGFTPGRRVLPNIAVLGGYVFMEEGKPDPLYIAYVGSDGYGYYNPRTMNTYYLCDNGTGVCVTSGGIRILRVYRQ